VKTRRRVAVLADVHGNVDALDAVLAEIRTEPPDLVVVAGDVTWGPFPRATLNALYRMPVPVRCVRGNAERALLGAPDDGAVDRWLRDQHDDRMLEEVRGFATSISLDVAGLGPVRVCHGSPRSDNELITVATPVDRVNQACNGVPEPMIVCAHTHMQFDRTVAGRRLVNPGSVGLPYERRRGAFWAVLGPDVELRMTEYGVPETARRIRTTSYPDAARYAGMLEQPPAPEVVVADAERRRFSD
jgi:putative phosphoesterase